MQIPVPESSGGECGDRAGHTAAGQPAAGPALREAGVGVRPDQGRAGRGSQL